jgi:futalosine hydrolase
MHILLCAATEMEIGPTILALSQKKEHSVKFLITGVGMLACTYALTKEVIVNRPDAVIQAGVAGTLVPAHTLASVVAVRSECIGDMGVMEKENFLSLFDLKFLGPNTQPWQNGKLVNESGLLKSAGLRTVDGVTVNEITTHEERIHYYRNSLQVQVESMEGAALHYVALLEKIPFLQIRSLSNFIGERNKEKWQLKEAVAHLNHALQHLLTQLKAI